MMRPELLDLYCCQGGATCGYQRAGFRVTGVDVELQPHYVGDEFIQADALEILKDLDFLSRFRAIHASPPCQFRTQMAASHRRRGFDARPDLLTPTRTRLRELGIPYVIENVPGAKDHMAATLILHGGMFGLGVHRPRLFETSFLILTAPASMTHEPVGVYGYRPVKKHSTRLNGNGLKRSTFRIARSLAEAQAAMGMDWGDWHGVKEAVPPAYTEFIGAQLLAYLEAVSAP